MKLIVEKEIKEVRKYEAIDGVVFNSKSECENYERNVMTLASKNYYKAVKKKEDSFEYFRNEGGSIEFVTMSDDNIGSVRIYLLCNAVGLLLDNITSIDEIISKAKNTESKTLMVFKNSEGEPFDIDTPENIIKHLKEMLIA